MPPCILTVDGTFYHIVSVRINFTVTNIPPAIFVLCKTVVVKINFTIFDVPPTVFILCNSCAGSWDNTIFDIPPFISDFYNICVIGLELSVFHITPVFGCIIVPFRLDKSGTFQINGTVFYVVPCGDSVDRALIESGKIRLKDIVLIE